MNEDKKQSAFLNGRNPDRTKEKTYWFYEAVLHTPGEKFHNIRRAKIDSYILNHYSVCVEPSDLLVGRYSTRFDMTEQMQKDFDLAKQILESSGPLNGSESASITGLRTASTGHRVIDYAKLLNKGIRGVMDEIDAKLATVDERTPDGIRSARVLESMKISLRGVCDYAARVRAHLEQLADRAQDERSRAAYLRMAENFKRAPWEPCTGFYEAVQCMWFMQFCLALLNDITLSGRVDNYLYPFYERDIANGKLTKEFAMEIIEDLYYKHNELYDSWPASVMVGGVDEDGNPVCNDLTRMFVDAIGRTELINPSVAVAYTEAIDEELLEKCVETVADGYTRPSIFNDRIVREGLMEAGVSERDARQYIHSTCVEITPIAASNILVATPYINLCKAFEYILCEKSKPYVIGLLPDIGPGWGGDVWEPYLAHDMDFSLDDIHTYDEFLNLFKKVAAQIIEAHVCSAIEITVQRSRYHSSPLASAFLNDCIERGRDSGDGGARYNFLYPNFPGVINVIDSLAAIRQCVFEEKKVTLRELGKICRDNFKGNEQLRSYILNRCPKFGNNDERVDSIGVDVYNFISDELAKYKECSGGTCHPSYFAYLYHGFMGQKTDATPDGRLAGAALSEHIGAFCGMDKQGPIAVMRSISRLDQKKGIGGIATNYRFAKPFIKNEKGRKAVANFIRVFMENDCFEIQFNVVDREDLLAAQKEPEKYQTLLVRVAGYSDYFVNLPDNIQAEIIQRTENGGV